jgi:mono/diheme cytochrome c family protein
MPFLCGQKPAMSRLLYFLLPGLLTFFTGCAGEPAQSGAASNPVDSTLLNAGFAILEANCIACHSPNPASKGAVAPSLAEIKMAYAVLSAEDFVSRMARFLQHPAPEHSTMPQAIQRYGLMPKMALSEEQVAAVVHYLQHQPVATTQWYAGEYPAAKARLAQEGARSQTELERGASLAMATKSVLGKNLLQAINSQGLAHALAFCNTRAYPLTDSMSQALGARIRRVSDRPRNPLNRADELQRSYIRQAAQLMSQGQEAKPLLQTIGGRSVGYYPITTNDMCLKCHGRPNADIQPATLARIKALYPQDEATGYAPNELRGIFVVEMDKERMD